MITTAIVFLCLGLAAFALPWVMPGVLPPIVGFVAGAVLIVLSAIMAAMRLYRKTSANEAFVRTGQGGARPVLDGWALVIPMFHSVIPISLETMKLDVERYGEDALITRDNLRVDVRGEFYIKVADNKEDIVAAARSLGSKGTDSQQVARLVFEKLVSALRSVAATMDLVEIHSRREEFARAVFESVREDLKHNGLTLESVTVSRLDQTDPRSLSDENIFDAQGKKKITEITQSALTERNKLTRMGERERIQQDVETRQQVLELEKARADAEARQEAEIANIRAGRTREQREYAIQQEQQVREAELAQQQAVEARRIQQELAVQSADLQRQRELIVREQEKQQADIERQQAIQTAGITQEQAVEVARRQREITIAQKEAERAAAQREALEAEAARERAQQEVLTVTATSQAEREAQTLLIGAKQVIEQDKIKRQTDVEVEAFKTVQNAEAEREAARRSAEARLQLAEAEAKAKERNAQADQASRMVEVNVERERVNVEGARVEVERQELENRQTFDRAAIEFETMKLQIEAMKDIQIALAESLGEFMSRGNFQIYGDPTTMAEMTTQFTKGLGFGAMMDGLIDGTPDSVKKMLGELRPVVDRITHGNGDAAKADEAEADDPLPEPPAEGKRPPQSMDIEDDDAPEGPQPPGRR